MHNEFVLVKSRKHKRKAQVKSICPDSSQTDIDKSLHDSLTRKVKKISEDLGGDRFFVELLEDISRVVDKSVISNVGSILCLGLGKFSSDRSSLHQLALLINFQKAFGAAVHVFDPAFDCLEIELLKELNFEIVTENKEGKHTVDGRGLTLAFFPHCPKQLVNNFLWANWNDESLKNCIVISNSFAKILQNNSKRTIAESAYYISKLFDFCEEIEIRDIYEFPNVFNDMSIHFFHKIETNCNLFQFPAREPEYREDTEFITKELSKIEIENE